MLLVVFFFSFCYLHFGYDIYMVAVFGDERKGCNSNNNDEEEDSRQKNVMVSVLDDTDFSIFKTYFTLVYLSALVKHINN